MQTAGVSAQGVAARVVCDIIKNQAFSHISISHALDNSTLNREDKALCHAMVHTALERLKTLEFVVDSLAKTKPDIQTAAFLYVGITQIFYMDKVPDNAACNETVKAAKQVLDKSRCGFINGVLRNVCRNRSQIQKNIADASQEIRLSVDKSIINLLKSQYPQQYEQIMADFFTPLPLYLRVNRLITTAQAVLSQLLEQGVQAEIDDGAIRVESGASKALKLLDEGKFFVQGKAAQGVSRLLDCQSHMLVIDVCACPGGKAFGAAIDMGNVGEIIAMDVHQGKLALIEKTAKTLGITIIRTQMHDSQAPYLDYIGRADKVICDVPCTALGLISSKPELRYKNMQNNELLYKTQRNILRASAQYLKSGGALVYSTCTINKMENEQVIDEFLAQNSDFSLAEQQTFLPFEGTEGFYIAKLVKQ